MPEEKNGKNEIIDKTHQEKIQGQSSFTSGLFEEDLITRTILESLGEGVVVIDKSGTLLFANTRAEQMFGYQKNELVGRPHSILLPKRYHSVHEFHMVDYYKDPKIRPMGIGLDLVGLKLNGSEFPVEISLSHIVTKNNFFVLSFISDITVRKKVDNDLSNKNKALDAFAHTLAHDIKNSVAIITGLSTVLNESLNDFSQEEKLDFLSRILKTGKKINHIIDGLLYFSSVSREEVQAKPVDMVPLVKSVVERLKVNIDESKAKVHIPEHLPKAFGYDSWVEEIWFNYIGNAIKYGGTPPEVHIGASVLEDSFVTYWVEDNGPGLSAEQHTTIFDVYHSRKEKSQKGFGLGLSIVKRITEKLNGRVGVKSGSKGGSVFFFSLPIVHQKQ